MYTCSLHIGMFKTSEKNRGHRGLFFAFNQNELHVKDRKNCQKQRKPANFYPKSFFSQNLAWKATLIFGYILHIDVLRVKMEKNGGVTVENFQIIAINQFCFQICPIDFFIKCRNIALQDDLVHLWNKKIFQNKSLFHKPQSYIYKFKEILIWNSYFEILAVCK